jgi:immunoglobulin-binding protein 1
MSSEASSSEVTLSVLLQRCTTESQDMLDASVDQAKLPALLANWKLCAALIDRLALFSPNEALEDLTTASLRCFYVEYFLGCLIAQLKSTGTVQRQGHLKEARVRFVLRYLLVANCAGRNT